MVSAPVAINATKDDLQNAETAYDAWSQMGITGDSTCFNTGFERVIAL